MPTFTTPEPITATLTTGGARVRIAASRRPDTVVRVEPVDSASASDVRVAEHTTVDFTAGALSVETTRAGGRNGSVAITVALPSGSRLVLETARTDVEADGPLGDCALDVASGRVRLDHVGALRGRLADGGVDVGHVAGAVDIEGGAAGVRLGEVEGTVRYQGSTGQVWIGHARSGVDLAGAGGSFAVDRADGDVVATAADCPIRVGRMTRGRAELTNASGGIEVGIGAAATAAVDAASTRGTVRDTVSTPENPDATVTVRARTRRDDIVIHPATA